jgi:hypothetical protein
MGEARQAYRSKYDSDGARNNEEAGFRAPLLLRAVIGLTARRGPLCLYQSPLMQTHGGDSRIG